MPIPRKFSSNNKEMPRDLGSLKNPELDQHLSEKSQENEGIFFVSSLIILKYQL